MGNRVSLFAALTSNRRRLFPAFVVVTLVLMVVLKQVGKPLITPAAPAGIVSYEFAGREEKTNQIIDSWDETARRHAAFSLGLDYLFMLAYSVTIAIGCAWAGEELRQRRWPLARQGRSLAISQGLAAVLDAVENVGLTLMLLGSVVFPWPGVAYWCAAAKFALVLVGLVFSSYGALAWVVGQFGERKLM